MAPVVSLVVGGLPLIVYPFVFLANVMSLAAEPDPSATRLLRVVSKTFLILSTAYPLVWLGALVFTIVLLSKHDVGRATWAAIVPLPYLVVVAALGWIWSGL